MKKKNIILILGTIGIILLIMLLILSVTDIPTGIMNTVDLHPTNPPASSQRN